MKVSEVAKRLEISESTVRDLIRMGEIPGARVIERAKRDFYIIDRRTFEEHTTGESQERYEVRLD